VKALKSQQTKFGTVLVVETLPQPQRLLLGFQINPLDKLQELLHFTSGLLQKMRANPEFGICPDHIMAPDVLEAAAHLLKDDEQAPSEYDVVLHADSCLWLYEFMHCRVLRI
jgi:hypothetical protein